MLRATRSHSRAGQGFQVRFGVRRVELGEEGSMEGGREEITVNSCLGRKDFFSCPLMGISALPPLADGTAAGEGSPMVSPMPSPRIHKELRTPNPGHIPNTGRISTLAINATLYHKSATPHISPA